MIETEDVVEAVARVMCAANFARQGCEGEFGSVDDCWFAWADEARAVLAATPIERLREENARVTSDCRFLLSCIDQSNEAGAPVDESDPEDIATIDQIRAALNQQ